MTVKHKRFMTIWQGSPMVTCNKILQRHKNQIKGKESEMKIISKFAAMTISPICFVGLVFVIFLWGKTIKSEEEIKAKEKKSLIKMILSIPLAIPLMLAWSRTMTPNGVGSKENK